MRAGVMAMIGTCGPRPDVQLLEDVADVHLDGASAQAGESVDFEIAFSVTDPLHHFAFAPSQAGGRQINRHDCRECLQRGLPLLSPGGGVHFSQMLLEG